ncbi:LacI family DNA-binding transcriptional regulator [Microbacterium sp.]|uniref:LacI family DNA-binding transcriptional regulator n=1 Tax=Microbacterium sp. TaxID=51671 RepID=UPI00281255D6|nr:LacI family DNA-binding transcriptional regulator [Microbacterium sp.]
MPNKTGRVTAAQVARHSGVSQATVSYVLNDNPSQKISPETRERVLRSVAELGYTPFEPARTLRSGHSAIVLFVMPDYPIGHVIDQVSAKLVGLLARQGRTLLTHRLSPGAPLVDIVRALHPVAVMSMTPLDATVREQMTALGTRVEIIGFDESPGVDVRHPQERVGRMQAEHLVARGHRRLAYALPDDDRARMFYRPRLEAIRTFCAERSVSDPLLGVVSADIAQASQVLQEWRAEGVTGVCAFTDDVAIAVIGAAAASGIRVPDDLAVIGVDDIPLAAVTVPPLTTVHLDVEAMARALVRPLGMVEDAPVPDEAWVVQRSTT